MWCGSFLWIATLFVQAKHKAIFGASSEVDRAKAFAEAGGPLVAPVTWESLVWTKLATDWSSIV